MSIPEGTLGGRSSAGHPAPNQLALEAKKWQHSNLRQKRDLVKYPPSLSTQVSFDPCKACEDLKFLG